MYSTLKNVFTVLCATITLFMICQLFITFVVKKPTTSSKEEKELEITDLPKVAICMEHGFNNVTLNKREEAWEGIQFHWLQSFTY